MYGKLKNLAALAAVLAAVGCGGSHLSKAQVEDVNAAIRAAGEVGAKDEPRANLHLHLAQEQLEQAKAAARAGEDEDARLLLKRAKVDAELAIQMAHTLRSQREAKAAWSQVNDLQKANQ
jgi:hypothetical protein